MPLPINGAMWTRQTIAPQQALGLRYGNPKATSVRMVLATILDPAANAVTISVNGAAAVNVTTLGATWTAIGTDIDDPLHFAYNLGLNPQLGFVCDFTISGLNAFGTDNPYTAAQVNSGSVSGNLVCAPASGDDFVMYVGTCDNTYSGYDIKEKNEFDEGLQPLPLEPMSTGLYYEIRKFAESPPANHAPCAGICIVDDVIYADDFYVDDSYTGSGGTGHVISDINVNNGPRNTGLVYDYALAYFCQMGMLGDVSTGWVDNFASPRYEYHGYEQAWGRNPDKLWCMHNLPMMPQMGDHEFQDDFGGSNGDRVTTGALPLPNVWNGGITPYNAIFRPLQGDAMVKTSDTAANHWSSVWGDLKIVCPDGIWNAFGDGGGTIEPITTLYGSGQIDDCLTALDSTETFKLLLWPYQMRSPGYSQDRSFAGASWSFYDMNLAEYQQFFTESGNTIKSWMDNPRINGATGKGVIVCGDFHRMHAISMKAPQYGSAPINLAEDIDFFCAGTISPNVNFGFGSGNTYPAPLAFAVGGTYRDNEILYNAPTWTDQNSFRPRKRGFGVVRIDIFSGTTPKRMRVRMLDGKYDDEYWQGEWSKDFTV